MVAAATILHFAIGTTPHTLHAIHILLRGIFLVATILAGLWFGLWGGVFIGGWTGVILLLHARISWMGNPDEQINQLAFAFVLIVVGSVTGSSADALDRERTAREKVERDGEKRALIQGLQSLCQALGYRDTDTLRHCRHTARLCKKIAFRMNLSSELTEDLQLAALVHDLGKIGIADDILSKPGALSEEEKRVVEQHPAVAANILQSLKGAERISAIVYAHHERLDGSGYPEGLKGEAIPVEVRVLALADVFSALTMKRPYHEPMRTEDALRYLRDGESSRLDLDLLEVLGEVLKAANDESGEEHDVTHLPYEEPNTGPNA